MIIHKRVHDCRKGSALQDFLFQACKPEINSDTRPDNTWWDQCRNAWKYVNCPKCLELKGQPLGRIFFKQVKNRAELQPSQ